MRRQYFSWSIGVVGIIGTAYGSYLLIYHYNHGKGLFVPGLLLLIIGLVSLAFFITFSISVYISKKKNKKDPEPIEVKKEEPSSEAENEKKEVVETKQVTREYKSTPNASRTSVRYESGSSYSSSTIYIKQVGYGPILRINGNRILDMRNNTYYRIEDNIVNQEGYGIRYEIRGNQIRDAFDGYLYELSGDNINKVFGGFYASISGNYINLYDLSAKYETTDSLSKKQILVFAALAFGKY